MPRLEELARLLNTSPARLRAVSAHLISLEPHKESPLSNLLGALLAKDQTSKDQTHGTQARIHSPEQRTAQENIEGVFLLDEDGSALGVVPRHEALRLARERGLELFLVRPDSTPPVARIVDYGAYKFELNKIERAQKKKNHSVKLKEIQLSYKIAEGDFRVKVHSAAKLLSAGDKVKLLIILRGREVQHQDLAMVMLDRFANELHEVATVEKSAKIEGKSIMMTLKPLPQNGNWQNQKKQLGRGDT